MINNLFVLHYGIEYGVLASRECVGWYIVSKNIGYSNVLCFTVSILLLNKYFLKSKDLWSLLRGCTYNMGLLNLEMAVLFFKI